MVPRKRHCPDPWVYCISNVRKAIWVHVDEKQLMFWRLHSVTATNPSVTNCDGRPQT